jgi:hypothetical protein
VLGRLIGAIVVIGSLVALLVGALAVVGSGANRPLVKATPTLAVLAGPSPTVTPIHPTPAPTVAASPTPPPASPSPSPSPFAVELVEGPGKITFASDYTARLSLINPHVEFAMGDNFAWRANIGKPVGTVTVDFNVFKVDTTTSAETLVHSSSFVGKNASALLYYAKAAVRREVDGPGVFVMRYSVQGATISEGYFRVNP